MNAPSILTSESKRLLSDISQQILQSPPIFETIIPVPIQQAFIKDYNTYAGKAAPAPTSTVERGAILHPPATFSFSDIPRPIVETMRRELTKEVRYVFQFATSKVILICYLIEGDTISPTLLNNVYIWFSMLNEKAGNVGCAPPKELVCWLYLTSAKKTAPNITSGMSEIVLSPINANTAFTRTCVRGDLNEIVIYRKEEWFKVLIHETIHTYGLDFSNKSDEELANCAEHIRQVLGLTKNNTVGNIYESYTELWAEITNILFIWCNIPAKRRGVVNVNTMLLFEMAFGAGQMRRVLDTMGLDIDDIMAGAIGNKYVEKTSILAYYILKNIALCNIGEFFKDIVGGVGWEAWGKECPYLEYVNFGTNRGKIGRFCKFLTRHEYIKKCNNLRILPVDGDTMRMTVWEMK